MFQALASLLEQGSEEIATIGAMSLRFHVNTPCSAENHKLATNTEISALLTTRTALPCATEIAPVMDQLSWHYSGYEDGRISADVALRMQTVELIGADGMIFDPSCRVGLFAQTANTDYVIRKHSAEELFVQIAGEGEWYKQGVDYTLRQPGDRMHHATYQPHDSRTKNQGLIALWVWAGDVAYQNYSYAGCNAPISEKPQ